MTHDEANALLDAYLDDELDLATGLAVEAHLRNCQPCAAWLAERRSMLGRVRAAVVSYPVPAEVRARVSARLAATRQRDAAQVQWLGALAAGLIVGIGGFLLGHGWPRPPDLRAELVGASVRAMLSSHPIDVLSSDHHTVKPWLSSQLPFSPPVPELAEQGDALLGARVDYLGSIRVAALVYQHGHHQINVYLWPRSAMGMHAPADSQTDGYRLLSAQAGAFTAVMVSDLGAEELRGFRERWRTNAASSGEASAAGDH
jgi:anti-sigma factor RsiW